MSNRDQSCFPFERVNLSLFDLLGRDYVEAALEARCRLTGRRAAALRRAALQKIDFFPSAFHRRLEAMLPKVGMRISRPLRRQSAGASTRAFCAADNPAASPLSGLGYYRVGADGRLYMMCKCEHYHVSLGHAFPGYELIDRARRLGLPSATHNNTRGEITRILELELIRAVNGLRPNAPLKRLLSSERRGDLNRVLNLQTGSLSAEAAIKMMLARFYRVQPDSPPPVYAGRKPVFVVMGDVDGGPSANYHGTTIITQIFRGMWPDLLGKNGPVRVAPVRPDDLPGLERTFVRRDKAPEKIAGLLYEPVLMNYGARKLGKAFVRRLHALCRERGVPVMVDEIQTALWHPDLFMFRSYGVRPTFVILGKGFPGGEFCASRVIFSADMDCLPQFGALVTNGQEDLASLSYLVTMRWAQANQRSTRKVGRYYQLRLQSLADRFPRLIAGVEGEGHLAALTFRDLVLARLFAAKLVNGGLDISVQAYKQACPPAALTKLPLIVGPRAIDFVIDRMDEALRTL